MTGAPPKGLGASARTGADAGATGAGAVKLRGGGGRVQRTSSSAPGVAGVWAWRAPAPMTPVINRAANPDLRVFMSIFIMLMEAIAFLPERISLPLTRASLSQNETNKL
jgi:hypothetical protein